MGAKALTDAELLVLGLVAAMPRHGYQLDLVIEQRAMREWTQIGFSSIYFVLGQLEKMGLVSAGRKRVARGSVTAKKIFTVTKAGRRALVTQTQSALSEVRPAYSSLLLGMVNWSALKRTEALRAFSARRAALGAELKRLREIQAAQQPLPDFVEAIFEYSLGQLRNEARWVEKTLDYMRTKPWLD